jgi:N,N'-diacetylchitobiose transport system substrate-binding protein
MRYRVLAVVAAAIALSVVAATTAQSSKAAGHTLTVWLQVDAQNGWPQVVAAASNSFENSHPGWNVNVQYQSWGDHLQ